MGGASGVLLWKQSSEHPSREEDYGDVIALRGFDWLVSYFIFDYQIQ